MNLKHTVTHTWDWWAYQFRVVHRQGIPEIKQWDERLVAFITYVLELQAGERLLDVACGSGVHARRLARQGLEVVGLDVAPSLVRYCREQAAAEGLRNVNASFVEGDMRALPFENAFDALTILSTSFGFFDDESNQRVLEGVARALKPGGRFLFQLQDLSVFVEQQRQHHFWQQRPEGVYWSETWYDPSTCVHHGVFRFTDNDGVTHLWDDHERLRLYTLPELRQRLAWAGLSLEAAYGEVRLLPVLYGPDCHEEMIVVGRKNTDLPAS